MNHERLGGQTPDIERPDLLPVWYGRFINDGKMLSIFYNAIHSWHGERGETWDIQFDKETNRTQNPNLKNSILVRTATESIANNLYEVFLIARDSVVTTYETPEENIAATRDIISAILTENPQLRKIRSTEE